MSDTRFRLMTALATTTAGTLFLIAGIGHDVLSMTDPLGEQVLRPGYLLAGGAMLVATLAAVLGTTGVFADQADRLGAPGVAAFVPWFVGLVGLAGLLFGAVLIAPTMERLTPGVLDAAAATAVPALAQLRDALLLLLGVGAALFGTSLAAWGDLSPVGGSLIALAGGLMLLPGLGVGVLIAMGCGLALVGIRSWRRVRRHEAALASLVEARRATDLRG